MTDLEQHLRQLPCLTQARLTPRQLAVALRLLTGESEKQVALALGLSRSSVHSHVKLLYANLGVSGRAEFFARVLRDLVDAKRTAE